MSLGLPGLWAMRKGARFVGFCDYNENVLVDVTLPAVEKERQREGQAPSTVKFYAGPWGTGLTALLRADVPHGFDLILTAETTYRNDLANALAETIADTLAKPNGVAFIATKRYYFGTGGGKAAFLAAIAKFDGLKADVVWSCENGKSNIRDILRVSWCQQGTTTPS